MTDTDLDQAYTALCRALGDVGPQRSELLLSMVCLAMMARSEEAGPVLDLIERSRRRLQEEAAAR